MPKTALVSDEIDRIIFGVVLMIFGLFIYRSGTYIKLGDLFWKKGGKNVYEKTNDTIETVENNIEQTKELVSDTVYVSKRVIDNVTTKLGNALDDQALDPKTRFEKKVEKSQKN
jgi:hypothetical protein